MKVRSDEMTEFTKEYIHKVRVSSYLIEPPAGIVVGECLDEIERLQVRVTELEAERRWIPVSERLPAVCEMVSWTHKSWLRTKEGYLTEIGRLHVWGGAYHTISGMKWRPLFQPPEIEE